MKEYKKSYIGLIVWIIVFVAVILLLSFIKLDERLMILLIDNVLTIGVTVLAYMIYVNEKIYWYNGIRYEDAKKADSQARKNYAYHHLLRFCIYTFIYLIYSIFAALFMLPYVISIILCVAGLILTAISTITIKLE